MIVRVGVSCIVNFPVSDTPMICFQAHCGTSALFEGFGSSKKLF